MSSLEKEPIKKRKRVIKLKPKKKIEVSQETPQEPLPQSLEEQYLSTFTDKEKQAYEIAKHHLQTSFSLHKSVGYQAFLKRQSQ